MGFFSKAIFGAIGDKIISNVKDGYGKHTKIQEMISRAEDYVKSGQNIYENAYASTTQALKETESIVEQHLKFRKNVANELGEKIEPTIVRFEANQVSLSVPKISKLISTKLSTGAKSIVKSKNTITVMDILTYKLDYEDAERQLDEAKNYYSMMKLESEKLYLHRDKLKNICQYLRAEEKEINVLLDKVCMISDDLQESMNSKKIKFFAFNQKKRMKELVRIAKKIIGILRSSFLTDSFEINEKYKEQLEKIKNINKELPSIPSLKESNYTIKLINTKVN